MTNMEKIKERVQFHLRDMKYEVSDLEKVILDVMNDIALETHLFKKIVGFTIHEDKSLYDFRDLLRMNEQVENELANVTIGDISNLELLQFILNPEEFPDPEVTKDTFVEEDAYSQFINLVDIYDSTGTRITSKFTFHGTAIYHVHDEEWLKENDGKKCAFVATVIPHIDELLPEDLNYILPTVIEGCKYFMANSMASPDDAQVANLFYQRYWNKKKDLMNHFPNMAYGFQDRTKDRKWL